MTVPSKRLETIYVGDTKLVLSLYYCPSCRECHLVEKVTTYSNGKKSSKFVCSMCHRGFKIKEVIP